MRLPRRHARTPAAIAGVGVAAVGVAAVGLVAVGLVAVVPPLTVQPAGAALADVTSRVSVGTGASQGNDASFGPSISADGRYVAFTSFAGNLVPGDGPFVDPDGNPRTDADVFVHDRRTGETTRVSVASDGTERNDDTPAAAIAPSISADGRHVAFLSEAAFDPADTDDGGADVYVHDRSTGATAVVSSPLADPVNEFYAPSISADGRRVAYVGQAVQPVPALFVLPRELFVGEHTVRLVAVGSVPSTVAIRVEPAAGATGTPDVSVGVPECPLSALAPGSACDLLVVARDPAVLVISDGGVGSPHRIPIRRPDVPRFAYGTTAVSLAAAAPCCGGSADLVGPLAANIGSGDPGASQPSTTITFRNTSPDPLAVSRLDLDPASGVAASGCVGGTVPPAGSCTVTASLRGVGRGPQPAALSLEFHHVCPPPTSPPPTGPPPTGPPINFTGNATHLAAAPCSNFGLDTDPVVVFGQESLQALLVTDRDTDGNGVLDEPAGTATIGLPAPDSPLWIETGQPSLSGDGRYVAFGTGQPLLAGDGNGTNDVYRVDLLRDGEFGHLGPPALVSVTPSGVAGDSFSSAPSTSRDGHAVAFASFAADLLAAGDGNDTQDVFIRDVTAGSTVRASVTGAGAEADGRSRQPALSADGRSVAFVTDAVNLGASGEDSDGDESPDTEVMLRDAVAGSTTRISVATGDATPPGTGSAEPAVSSDGRYAAFSAPAALVAGDTNEADDVFVRDRRPLARLAPNPLDFGDQPLRQTTGPLPLAITNAGTGPLVVGAFAVSATSPANGIEIDVDNPCLDITLFAGESCLAGVRVTAVDRGRLTATLTLTSPAAAPASVDVVVNGAAADLRADPSPLDVGARAVGTLGPVVPLTLTNTGTVPLRLTDTRVDGPMKTDIGLVPSSGAEPCPGPAGTLAVGATCTVGLRFQPDALGVRTAALVVDAVGIAQPHPSPTPVPSPPAGAPDRPFTVTVPLTGTGLPGGLAAAPNPAGFGPVPLGQTGPRLPVTVRVVGPSPVRLGVPTLSGMDTARFTLDAAGCAGRTLPAGGSCPLVLRLTPDRVGGPITASVLVPSADLAAPLVVKLIGAGAAPTLELDPPVGPPGTVVHVTGSGYPPGGAVDLSWEPGLGGEQTTANPAGRIDDYVLVFRRDRLGVRQAVASGVAGVHVEQPFLVLPPGAAPPKFSNDR